MAAEAMKDLDAVRLDTPSSRRGDFAELVREIRWELDLRGYDHVQIFVSGGLNEESVKRLGAADVDAFGIGTYISNSPTIDFALDIIEVEGKPCAKRGKLGGRKEVWRCQKCLADVVLPSSKANPKCPNCGGNAEQMLKALVKNGRIVAKLPKPKEIRKYVLEQLADLSLK